MLDPLVITFTADDLEDVRAVTVECIYSALCGLEDSDEVAKSLSGVQNVLTLLGAWHRLGCGCLGFIEPGGLTADGMEALAAALPELLGFYERSTSPQNTDPWNIPRYQAAAERVRRVMVLIGEDVPGPEYEAPPLRLLDPA